MTEKIKEVCLWISSGFCAAEDLSNEGGVPRGMPYAANMA